MEIGPLQNTNLKSEGWQGVITAGKANIPVKDHEARNSLLLNRAIHLLYLGLYLIG
jgi:hypothetical protein